MFLQYLNFCLNLLGCAEKQLNKEVKVNFKTYPVISRETSDYDTHTEQYLK